MNKKKVLGAIIIIFSVAILAKQLFFNIEISNHHSITPSNISIQEILRLVEEKEQPILMHVYALNPSCPNCDVEFIETELAKVAELEKAYGQDVQFIRINIFDYPQHDIVQLAKKLELTQAPTTLVISQQQIRGKAVGAIFLAETQSLLEEVTGF